jgi:hypothetical protein
MIKNKLFIVLMTAMGLVQTAFAQLSGNYTVGGTSPDYLTPLDAVADLQAQGVSGSVVFNIRDGVYTGKITINAITGASATNTVTFQSESGDSSAVVITSPAVTSGVQNYTLGLIGADYINVSKLSIKRSGTAISCRVIEISGGADENKITNCDISNDVTNSNAQAAAIVFSPVGSTDNNNEFSFNKITNGSFAVFWYGAASPGFETGNMFMNNVISGQNIFGIQAGNQADLMISNNNFDEAAATFGTAIYLSTTVGNTMILANKINLQQNGTGVNLQQCGSVAVPGEIMVANNFISIGPGGNLAYGIRINGCISTGIYYNNINNRSTVISSSNYAFFAEGTANNVKVLNNVFAAVSGYVVGVSAASITQMDYNDLFTTGFNFGYYNNTVNINNFANWQATTTLDANSVNVNPQFVSATDLHIQTFGLNAEATPIPGILMDIDGDLRDVAMPDIGADETSPPSNDAGVTKLLSPFKNQCGGGVVTVTAIIKNYAALTLSNIKVMAEITGTQTINLIDSLAGPLGVAQSDTITFTQTLTSNTNGDTLYVKLYTMLDLDEDVSNDTLMVDSLIFAPVPAAPLVPTSTDVCFGNTAAVNATLGANQQVYWYDAPTAGNLIATGNPLTVNPTVNTNYYAEVRDTTLGTGGCIRISEIDLADASSFDDFIEITNLSGGVVDATGWFVAASESYTAINTINPIVWNLGVLNPGEVQIRYDAAGAGSNYWGTNLLFNPGNNGWVIIVDNLGNVVDFVAFGWTATDLANFNITVNGFNITLGSKWIGDGAVACATNTSVSRIGNTDSDTQADWTCQALSELLLNPSLSQNLSGCGGGCPSQRSAVAVNVLALPTVFLGNDTLLALPNTITLDAGSGGATYLWSDGSTNQTLLVTTTGTYTVTVTNAMGCSASDNILVTILVGINDFGVNSSFVVAPNPAKDFIQITLNNFTAADYQLTLLNNLGQTVLADNVSVNTSQMQHTMQLAGLQRGVYYVQVKSSAGIARHRILLQ